MVQPSPEEVHPQRVHDDGADTMEEVLPKMRRSSFVVEDSIVVEERESEATSDVIDENESESASDIVRGPVEQGQDDRNTLFSFHSASSSSLASSSSFQSAVAGSASSGGNRPPSPNAPKLPRLDDELVKEDVAEEGAQRRKKATRKE
jgi:hypothetical protein